MQNDTRLLRITGLFLVMVICLCGQTEKSGKTIGPKKGVRNLVRKELLSQQKEDFSPPKRNIFSAAQLVPVEPTSDQERTSSLSASKKSRERIENAFENVQITYAGYIQSAHRILGLVFLEGEARAVEEGEFLREGIQVVSITPREIEILGPDSRTRKISIQGEEE